MTEQNVLPPVARVLREQGIPFRVYRHAGPVRSLAQAAQERGQRLEQVVRSLLFRVEEGRFVLVLMPGGLRVDWPALRRHLGVSRVTMATPEEVLAVTGYPVGAVGPLGLRQEVPVLADPRVFEPEEVSIGSGERGVALILRSVDLRRALGPKVVLVTLGQPDTRAG